MRTLHAIDLYCLRRLDICREHARRRVEVGNPQRENDEAVVSKCMTRHGTRSRITRVRGRAIRVVGRELP